MILEDSLLPFYAWCLEPRDSGINVVALIRRCQTFSPTPWKVHNKLRCHKSGYGASKFPLDVEYLSERCTKVFHPLNHITLIYIILSAVKTIVNVEDLRQLR